MNKHSEEFQAELRLSHFTIEHLPDAAFWHDCNAKIHKVNEMACTLYGYSREELLQKTILDLDPHQSKKEWRQYWEELKAQKEKRVEKYEVTKDGKWFPIELLQYYFEFEGKGYCCSFIRDITERKRSQDRLQESQRQLLTLINNLAGCVYRCKPDLQYEFITEWSEKITGYPTSESKNNKKFFVIHPDDAARVRDKFWKSVHSQTNDHIQYRIITKTGETKWVIDRFEGVFSDKGELIAIEGFFSDIDHQVQSELKLKSALDEVETLKKQLEDENVYLRQEIKKAHNVENIIYQSELVKQVLKKVQQVAVTPATVLIMGETGTGKELIARSVHNLSNRKPFPLVTVNCAALPANLIESELFGHEKGAFTGAVAKKIGRFELANKGTLFLDEIGELPLDLQAKLLRVLQEGEFERLGSTQTIKVDVRVIAATNRDLKEEAKKKTFREDLYYRLNVFPIHIPALRERSEDIPLLVNHFMYKYGAQIGKKVTKVSRHLMEKLKSYNWPGNIRELENVVERAVIISPGTNLELGDWQPKNENLSRSGDFSTYHEHERQYIMDILNSTHWRIRGEKGAAKIMDLKPTTLESKMKKLGIHRRQ